MTIECKCVVFNGPIRGYRGTVTSSINHQNSSETHFSMEVDTRSRLLTISTSRDAWRMIVPLENVQKIEPYPAKANESSEKPTPAPKVSPSMPEPVQKEHKKGNGNRVSAYKEIRKAMNK